MSYPECISASGLTIYDAVRDKGDLYIPDVELENTLRNGLVGMDLSYPLRTRSKVLKSKICEILGYPIPKTFKKTQPRFTGQDFDTYIQKSNNLQIWNEEISATRRYVIIRVDDQSQVTAVRVVTGEALARLDNTGVLTKKFQAKSRCPVVGSVLVTQSDSYELVENIRALAQNAEKVPENVNFERFMPIADLYGRLLSLIGKTMPDPGLDQERNRGGALHEAVCLALGMEEKRDTGTCPDVVEQLLELKLQTSPTIDLGLVSPDDESPLHNMPGVRHCDIRYAVFYGSTDGAEVDIQHIVLCAGKDFFKFFQRFEGKVINTKLQIPLPSSFFD